MSSVLACSLGQFGGNIMLNKFVFADVVCVMYASVVQKIFLHKLKNKRQFFTFCILSPTKAIPLNFDNKSAS